MLGPYDGLMRTQEQGMQATPVHHVGKGTPNQPQKGSIKDEAMGFLGEVENEMGRFRPGSHAHNQLQQMRGHVLDSMADMDIEHQNIPDQGVQNLTDRVQNLKSKMAPYQRGITPDFKPVR